MSVSVGGWTVKMLETLPDDGKRYEVVDGKLFVTPAPALAHQRAVGQLYLLPGPYAAAIGLDFLTAPAAVTFSARREVQPDLLVLPLSAGRFAAQFSDVGRLLLAVEVRSRHSTRTDRHVKRALYRDEGVPEYWIVDTATRAIERWRPDSARPKVLTTAMTWQPRPAREALRIDVVRYFRAVFGDDLR